MTRLVREHKRNYSKPDQEFECEMVGRSSDALLLRYQSEQSYRVRDQVIPAGAVTLGLYRARADYVFWKIIGPDRGLLGYLVHLCEPVQINEQSVSYRDLLLDIWQTPGAEPVLLDEDELEQAVASNLLPPPAAAKCSLRALELMNSFVELALESEALIAQFLRSTAAA